MHPMVKQPLMKKRCLLFFFTAFTFIAHSQSTYVYNDPQERFNEAKDYFQRGQYYQAYPIFKELRQEVQETDLINNPVIVQEIFYYTIASGLMQNESKSENEALEYINLVKNNARVQMMRFQLAE